MKDFYRALVIVLFILVGQATIDTYDEQTEYTEQHPLTSEQKG